MLRKEMKVATLALLALATVIGLVLATFSFWHMKITWTYEDTSFGVYTDATCTIPWNHTLDLTGVNSTPQSFNFTIKNEGNVPIDITIMNENITGGSASWSPTSLTNLAVGSNNKMTLILVFTAEGFYEFDFKSTKYG